MDQMRPGISFDIIDDLHNSNSLLSTQRKERKVLKFVPPTLTKVEAMQNFSYLSNHPLQKSSKPGILSIDIHPTKKNIIATGGLDKNAFLLDQSSGQIVSTLSGHSNKVTNVKFVDNNDLFLTASADTNVCLWKGWSEEFDWHVFRDHVGEVFSVMVHPSNKYFLTAALDNTWCFYDISSCVCLSQVGVADYVHTTAGLHPDGLLLGTGTMAATVRLWDIRTTTHITTLLSEHVGAITSLSFSENGYFLATAASDGVRLWDLRNLKNFATIVPCESNTATKVVTFDDSGSYLALAGSDHMRVYKVGSVCSGSNCIKTFSVLSEVTCVKFGPDAKYIAVGYMDRNLGIFSLPDYSLEWLGNMVNQMHI